ncbi:MAG: glycosyltransferase [Thiohalospira sp.]
MNETIIDWMKAPVKEYTNFVKESPKVSVCVQTYQHANFIKNCLDGILMQKTEFSFEILLGEDASTDGTRDICIEYSDKYPDKIRLFLHNRENVIYVNGNPTGRFNFLYNLFQSRGKYIALCEGDDYWTDPCKLQKQVDFLEANPEYGLVSGDVDLIDENGDPLPDNQMVLKQREKRKPTVDFFDLLETNLINTLTVCTRAELIKPLAERVVNENLWFVYDYWFWLNIALKSKIRIFDEKMAAYRVHKGGVSRKSNFFKVKKALIHHFILYEAFKHKHLNKQLFLKKYLLLLYRLIRARNIEAFAHILKLRN